MKTLSSVLTRRDRCDLFGRRAGKLSPAQAAAAWYHLAERIEGMGDLDVPKFNDLLIAFRVATVRARRTTGIPVIVENPIVCTPAIIDSVFNRS